MRSYFWRCLVVLLTTVVISAAAVMNCSRKLYIAKAEQIDENGKRCWDKVKVTACGGRCDSREIADWEFPFKKSHHPVCVHGARRPLTVHLRHCEPGATPGTEIFQYVAAEDCRCKVCSSQHTSCEWLPPNSTLQDWTGSTIGEESDEGIEHPTVIDVISV